MTNALIIKYSLKMVQWQLMPKGETLYHFNDNTINLPAINQ